MPSSILHPPSSLRLCVANRQRRQKINSQLLKQIAGELLAEAKVGDAELGINLVATREMIAVNETFLRHEGSTDVITFDYVSEESGARAARPRANPDAAHERAACARLHGEIFVCVDEAILQAKRFKTSWQSEVVRYVIHGVLHLLGYDDSRPSARRRMKREEDRLLGRLSGRFSLAHLGRAARLTAGQNPVPAPSSRTSG